MRCLHEEVEGRGSWDHSKAEELHRGIVDVAKDVAQLEAEAVGLDGQLSKAHLHISGAELTDSKDISGPQGRTSCRGQAVVLMVALEEVQKTVGWRQCEADALGALWCSFRERKEEVMKNLKKLEDDGRREEAREFTVQAFQNRFHHFNTDSIRCHQSFYQKTTSNLINNLTIAIFCKNAPSIAERFLQKKKHFKIL